MRTNLMSVGLWMLITAGIAAPGFGADGTKPAGGGTEAVQRIEIEADRLFSNNNEKFAEFAGNVKANQGDYRLTSDTLRIYYEGEPMALKAEAGGNEKIKKIVAAGNVRIEAEDYNAVTTRAEYDVATQILTLSGPDSTVTSGKNSIVGSKITLYRSEGRVKVDAESGKRVKAVFYPEGEEADFFRKPKEKTGE